MAILCWASRADSASPLPLQPLDASTASPSAATAAYSAFTRRESSTASLSAAAAAAALKARPTTPTNVAEVQTKRTRRSASRSSSAGRSTPDTSVRARGQLTRQSSSGSMTERTFRSPSPGAQPQRSLSSSGIPRNSYHSDDMAPPVPAIPQSVNMQAAQARQKPKSLGIVTSPVRTASQKANKAGGSWFGAAKTGDLANVRTSDAVMSTSPTAPAQAQAHPHAHAQRRESLDSPGSRGSPVNFSYPVRVRSPTFPKPEEAPQPPAAVPQTRTKPKPGSSTISPQREGSVRSARSSSMTTDQTLVYDPNSRRMVPQADLSALEQRIQAASESKPKKKKQAPARTGSHLAKGTVARSQGSVVELGPTNAAQAAAATSLRSHRAQDRRGVARDPEDDGGQPPLETVPNVPRTAATTGQETDAVSPNTQHAQAAISPASNALEVVPASHPPIVELQESSLQRTPSAVSEGSDPEDLENEIELEAPDRVSTPQKPSAALDSAPARQNVYAHGVPSPPRSDLTEDVPVEQPRPAPAVPIELAAAPRLSSPEPWAITRDGSGVVPEPQAVQNTRSDSRNHSKSPVRSARFGPVHDSLTVRHEPPPRSISPRKSALKHQSPPRGASPADATSDGSEAGIPSNEQILPRKKSVRVSFDDANTVVVGEAAGNAETDSTLPPSPQVASRRPWYSSLGLGKKKDAIPLEEDEGMKPRPILPTFGSVRGRKQSKKEPEERPLVRPHEPVHEESEPPTPEPVGKDVDPMGQSSDHALGVLIHEHEPRNEANISKFREPLPPVVTSVEGSGYASDTASDGSEAALMADTPRLQADDSRVSEASTLVPDWKPSNGSAHGAAGGERITKDVKDFGADPHDVSSGVPAISITQPSPRIIEPEQDRSSYRFPGEFPETDGESDVEHKHATRDATLTDPSAPARQLALEHVVQDEDATETEHTPSTVLATKHSGQQLTDESEGESVYSDAYEDPLDLEGDGFQSLDAVLGSSPRHTPSDAEKIQARITESPAPSLPQKAPGHESAAIAALQNEGVSGPVDDWEAAKAYWRSLSAEKRAQLEKEATEEAGAEGDHEDVKPDVKKPRRKKSIEKRNAEKKVIEAQRVAIDQERTYMVKPGAKAEDYGSAEQSKPSGPPASENPEAATKLRKTMRSPGANPSQPNQSVEAGSRMRKSLRSGAPSSSAAAPQPPASPAPAMGITTKMTGPNKHSRAVSESEGKHSIIQPSLRRHGSGSSASSFKRSRPASEGFGFRKTMRTGNSSQDTKVTHERQPSRLSLRSMSPGGGGAPSLRSQPRVTMDGRMRTTLRGGPPGNSRRSSQDSGKGYLRFSGSFGQKAKGGKGSRFDNNSSDEDESDMPRRFSSRFDDSSDEDIVPQPLPPLSMPKTMRGTRSRNAPPSPPLPEEEELSDEEGQAGDDGNAGDEKSHRVTSGPASIPQAQTGASVKRSRSGRGSLPRAEEGMGRPARRSFMSSVLGRNKKQGSGAISRPERRESAARTDTNLERTPGELKVLRSNSLRDRADSGATWPLQEDVREHEALESETTHEADDVKGAHVVNGQRSPSVLAHSKSQPSLLRPSFLQRRTMSHQGTINPEIIESDAGSRKKKKFGALRKMFKLDE
jgi:serine/arginine repetitive matrix protein 2